MDRKTDGWTYILSHRHTYMLIDKWTDVHADIGQSGRQQHSDIICLNTCQWRAGLRDEYTNRRTPSHFSHPHRQLRTHAHASAYMHALDVPARTYSFTPEFKHRSLS